MTATYRIAFLLVPDFQLLGLVNALEALRVANSLFARPRFEVRLVHDGESGPVVASSGGLPVEATAGPLDAQEDADALIVCCSFRHDSHVQERTLSLLRRFDRHGMRMGSIESGIYFLARAGLVNGHEVTAHFNNLPLFAQLFPEVRFVRCMFTMTETRMCAAGGTACLDMMLHLIAERLGRDAAARVANIVIHTYRQDGATFQDDVFTSRHSGLPDAVRGACRLMEQSIDPPLAIGELAGRLGLSRRQLDRLFVQGMGNTAAKHYRLIRLARARKLIKATNMDLADIAAQCGFSSYSHFVRRYTATFEASPALDRLRPEQARDELGRVSPLTDLHPFQGKLDPVRLI